MLRLAVNSCSYFTTSCKSTVRVAPVADATTVTVYVPCGVGVEEGAGVGVGTAVAVLLPEPPPHPATSSIRENKAPAAKIGSALLREFLAKKTHPASKAQDQASHIPDVKGKSSPPPLIVSVLAADGAVVLMKTLSLPPSMLRSIVFDEKLHCAPAGSPLQLNDKTPGRPEIVRASN